ncbi:MAG: FecR family protein [Candidatus Aureabacteria bacterium]|nr:FecR family protein [Candidatus Auribacterota bacterium]
MKGRFVMCGAGILLMVALCSTAGVEKVGTIVALKPPVMIERNGVESAANLGDEIHLKDVVTTGIAGRAKILFDGKVILVVAENTTIEITKHLFDIKQNTANSIFDLKSGLVRAILEKYHNTSLDISSRNAIAGVRGTDFLMRYTSEKEMTQVYVLRGVVEVKQRLETMPGAVSLKENQWMEIAAGNPPGAPQMLPKESAETLRGETSLPEQVSSKSQKAFKPAARSDAGEKAREKQMKKAAGEGTIIKAQNPQVSVVGQDLILPSSVGGGPGGGTSGLAGGAASAASSVGSARGLPGGSGVRVDQGGRPGGIGPAVGRPGGSGGVSDILGR